MRVTSFLIGTVLSMGVLAANAQHSQLPYNWYKTVGNQMQGVNTEAALQFLKEHHKKPKKTIIVGIIDSGVDTTSVDLRPAFWRNRKEKLNGRDDDRNGYIDDLIGWNFLGTKDGKFNMETAGTEEFRQFKRLYPKYKDVDSSQVADKKEFAYYKLMRRKAKIDNYIKFTQYSEAKYDACLYMDSLMASQHQFNKDTLTMGSLAKLPMEGDKWQKSCQMLMADLWNTDASTRWTDFLKSHKENLDLMKKRLEGIEKEPDKRLLMGDDQTNAADRFYGNPTVQAGVYSHGTFVAGVVAGQGVKNPQIKGVYPQARLMIVRAVPDGDEYDKDIASAIRYAVDNGAKVINMSFGKTTSPQAEMVNQAIAYAAAKDVLLVQAAGNSSLNVDSVAVYPTGTDASGHRFANYIRVGASDPSGARCHFSNYGAKNVDVFAPGEQITSVAPRNDHMESQGTSIASPVVTGVAALIRAYFPKLKAATVKRILMQSVRPMQEKGLSASNGMVDALAAVKLAMKYK